MDYNAAFQWKCHPKAEKLILRILDKAIQRSQFIATLANDLEKYTSTRLFDWIDHVTISNPFEIENELADAGFVSDSVTATYRVYNHPGAQLPKIVVYDNESGAVDIAITVDHIADFLMTNRLCARIEGSPFSEYRRSCVSNENEARLWVVERRGTQTMEPVYHNKGYLETYFEAIERWKSRSRDNHDEDEAMAHTIAIAQDLVTLLGESLAACVVLECEREYWQSRNQAAQIQKNRQDRLGMGWANHDHHTFRSSRRHFTQLVRLFEILGFHCRERFYAGVEAGWGAQVMENPKARLVLFLDVDLHQEEIEVDFAHHQLHDLDKLGTIGLWCALHGDSILKAGMHHLEAQFLFDELKQDLVQQGVEMMEPFSSFTYLKQAFTRGEIWPVDASRIEKLIHSGKLTKEQANKFDSHGAVGSHMENLQRREGYKGFNQKNVSFIIKKTDPRNQS